MELISEQAGHFVLKFSRGEELFSGLLSWAQERGLKGATLTGLGAADQLDIAYYNLAAKKYERHTINEEVEVLSLTGNIAQLDGKLVAHIHGVCGRRDLSTFGGHFFTLRISGAGEIHLTEVTEMNRAHDTETGLNLLCS